MTLLDEIRECTNCTLCKSMPFKPVPGLGPKNAKIMIVGEAPGYDESVVEEPFVGQAGRMLDRLLTEAGIDRKSTFVCNTVNCRPTDGNRNRPPSRTEIKACQGWLFKQIAEVKPELIFTLGKIPTYVVLGLKPTFKLHDYLGTIQNIQTLGVYENGKIKVIPNLHPSYVMVYGKKEVDLAIDIFRKGAQLVS